jgi:hypothetical protein
MPGPFKSRELLSRALSYSRRHGVLSAAVRSVSWTRERASRIAFDNRSSPFQVNKGTPPVSPQTQPSEALHATLACPWSTGTDRANLERLIGLPGVIVVCFHRAGSPLRSLPTAWAQDTPVLEVSDEHQLLDLLRSGQATMVALWPADHYDSLRSLLGQLAMMCIPVVGFVSEGDLAFARAVSHEDGLPLKSEMLLLDMARWCDGVVAQDATSLAWLQQAGVPASGHMGSRHGGHDLPWRVESEAYLRKRRPRVSVIGILYNKADEIVPVLRSWFRQNYDGEIEIVLVNDCTPDASVSVARAEAKRLSAVPRAAGMGSTPTLRIIENDRNSGNCISRNEGIRASTGDIVFVIDADCVVNRDFVRLHVDAHSWGDCDICIGPMNIEVGGRDPVEMLSKHEADPVAVLSMAAMQDPVNSASFLNCITRNFSIHRTALPSRLFDPAFGYSADPASGFGWEDVEMGFRLWQSGARIRFVSEAISLHVSPRESFDPPHKADRSLQNFRRLLEKHPDLVHVARGWARDTLEAISAWRRTHGLVSCPDMRAVRSIIDGASPVVPVRPASPRPLRICTYRWHVPHQYELYKLPHRFDLLTGLGCAMTEAWEWGQRPMPANARFVPADSVDLRDYDLAVLHFDENVIDWQNCNGILGADWGAAFRWFREHVVPVLPAIAVCHGTPQFRGQYNPSYQGEDLLQPIEDSRHRLVGLLADIPVVVNSYQAQREWQFLDSRVIWHGFEPSDFPLTRYERLILSPLGPLVRSRPHYRGYGTYQSVFSGFPKAYAPHTIRVPEPHPALAEMAASAVKYRSYVDSLRRYSIYFNPTLRSPMPRARGEPMMSGLVPVSLRNHDVELFVRNGVNGFHADEPDALREQLLWLCRRPEEVRRIGAAARQTAITTFNVDRYLADWSSLIGSVLGRRAEANAPVAAIS